MKKTVKAWCPKLPTGTLWVEWAKTLKKDVIEDLDNQYVDWKEEGLAVVPIQIKESRK